MVLKRTLKSVGHNVTYQKDVFREGELELYASVCLRGQVSSIIDSCLLWPFD